MSSHEKSERGERDERVKEVILMVNFFFVTNVLISKENICTKNSFRREIFRF